MKIYHYNADGKRTGYSETTTFFESLCGFLFGASLVIAIPIIALAITIIAPFILSNVFYK